MKDNSLGKKLKLLAMIWKEKNISAKCAELSFYLIVSIIPLLIIIVTLLGLFITQDAASDIIKTILSEILGDASEAIRVRTSGLELGIVGLASFAILALSATKLFANIQNSLNDIWEIKRKKSLKKKLIKRLESFLLIMMLGGLILAAIITNTALAVLEERIVQYIQISPSFLHSIYLISAFFLISIAISLIFFQLPDRRYSWKRTLIGAGITSFLFLLGNQIIGLYLSYSSVINMAGAMSQMLIILLWAYYSAHVFYLGAVITRVYK